MKRLSLSMIATLAACFAAAEPTPGAPVRAGLGGDAVLLRDATYGLDGFATIEGVPDRSARSEGSAPPPPLLPPPPPPLPNAAGMTRPPARAPDTYYGRLQTQTDDAYRLDKTLRARFPETYAGLDFERPDRRVEPRSVVFLFTRDAARSFAPYKTRPDFGARDVRYTKWDLARVFDRWAARFEPLRLMDGGGAYLGKQKAVFTMRVTKAEFDTVATKQGWTLPDMVELQFVPGAVIQPAGPPPVIRKAVRVFPLDDRTYQIQYSALSGGRIVLRDGCFRIDKGLGADDPLAYFSKGTTLVVDAAGYLAFATGDAASRGRVGQEFR